MMFLESKDLGSKGTKPVEVVGKNQASVWQYCRVVGRVKEVLIVVRALSLNFSVRCRYLK